MQKVDFRHRARVALGRARRELESGDPQRLKYAALELRMAIEAVTYERAQSYDEELPASEYLAWQPKKLMQMLLDIEPNADKSSSIAFGIEDVPGVEAKEMTFLGTEQVFGMRAIKSHYDALGSYLHLPTVKQIQENADVDLTRLEARCKEIAGMLEGVLASSVFNINFGSFSTIQCMNPDCGAAVRRRLPAGKEVLNAECRECGMQYDVHIGEQGQCTWRPVLEEIDCPTEACAQVFKVSPGEIKPGLRLHCTACGGRFSIALGLVAEAGDETSETGT